MNILFIDDNRKTLAFVNELLVLHGFPNEKYNNPTEAIHAYKEGLFDVVITDFQMSQMNGIEVLKAIKAHNPLTRVIIFTAFIDIENVIDALNNDVYAVFLKGYGLEGLIKTLSKIEKELSITREITGKIKEIRRTLKLSDSLSTLSEEPKNERHCITVLENDVTTLLDDIQLKFVYCTTKSS